MFGKIASWDRENEILIEPLPHMKIIRDLIVDMNPFWKFYQEIKPYFDKKWMDLAPETAQSPKDIKEIERLIYCILCGVCWTCPVSAKNKNYLGPAALTKGYRFIADTRSTSEHRERIKERVRESDGVPACEKVFACNIVCPRGVMPGTAIASIRKLSD
jgi:succinate dehydrogenase / fumarate reductase iron-sulfur subunit